MGRCNRDVHRRQPSRAHAKIRTFATAPSSPSLKAARYSFVLISTNLALAGLLAISLPLITKHLNYCGFSALTFLSWWAIVVLGALGGGLLLYAYHTWAVRRGFVAWSALPWGTNEAGNGGMATASPPWRRLWLWILLSFVALVAGTVLGIVGLTG